METIWRARRHRPSVVDDKILWSLERARCTAKSDTAIVFIGNSHCQLGISTATVRGEFPNHAVHQLSVGGSNPEASLNDLARDGRFKGIVIANISAATFDPELEKSIYVTQKPFVDYYHNAAQVEKLFNRALANEVQSRLSFVNPNVSLRTLAYTRHLPKPSYLVTLPDRSCLADYSVFNQSEIRLNRVQYMQSKFAEAKIISSDHWLERISRVEGAVKEIQSRGGKVTFVHFPLSGEIRGLEELRFPKKQYWDRWSKQTSAMTIHFADYTSLDNFDCPDGQHLDQRDAPRFTRELCKVLVHLGVLVP